MNRELKFILKSYMCIPCQIIDLNERSRNWHVNDHHIQMTNDNKFRCMFCDVSWETMEMHINHLNAEHTLIEYQCSYCNQNFITYGEAYHHIKYANCIKNLTETD